MFIKPSLCATCYPRYSGGMQWWGSLDSCIPGLMVLQKWLFFFFKQVNYDKVYQMHACMLSLVQLFVTLWAVAHQAPLSMEFSRQEYWNGLSFPPSGDLPNSGLNPSSLASPDWQADTLPTAPPGKPIRCMKSMLCMYILMKKKIRLLNCTRAQIVALSTNVQGLRHWIQWWGKRGLCIPDFLYLNHFSPIQIFSSSFFCNSHPSFT